ncbi:DUF4238 domain-containing protein [Sphingomonas sp. R1]|uniref:DUF4238 domain-containing protein n=1 Tax=Sphingomonas sp. R1 TaxID=399176 RepID=UPI00222569F5|nr:DUF4238 domain-containing protein [Sphingomonas sp. R1]UYY77510.1 DUF4238 domain-containing protein [Sphingomonas sp. R1]
MGEKSKEQGAQNQHYVPKIILRRFLSNEAKERVTVYDIHDDRQFVTSIRGIMAERRFNEFVVGEHWRVSFEESAWQIEENVKPTYEQIIRDRRLLNDPNSRAAISTLLAFQFLRTKAHRNRFAELDDVLTRKVEQMGLRKEDIEGWEPLTEDRLKRDHLDTTVKWLRETAIMMSEKDFLLAEAAPGTHFYLGDNPVALHNSNDYAPYGNLGLKVRGIQIYLPLSSDLLLCAWCPSILNDIEMRHHANMELSRKFAFGLLTQGKLNAASMKAFLEDASKEDGALEMIERFNSGHPIPSDGENMKFYNSLQVEFAERYVIDKRGDFTFAKMVAEDKKAGKASVGMTHYT